MIKKYLSLLLLFTASSIVIAQKKDFGIWYNANLEIGLSKKVEMDISAAVRTFENASKVEEGFGEIGLTYKVFKNVSLGGKYRFTGKLEDDSMYHPRHKWIADLKGGFDLGVLEISGRLRVQRQDKTYFEDANDEIPDYYLRTRLKTVYKTKSFPVNPYASLETFSRIFEAADKNIEKYRVSLGIEYKISKRHSVEAEYMFQRDHLPKLSDTSILGLSYNFKL